MVFSIEGATRSGVRRLPDDFRSTIPVSTFRKEVVAEEHSQDYRERRDRVATSISSRKSENREDACPVPAPKRRFDSKKCWTRTVNGGSTGTSEFLDLRDQRCNRPFRSLGLQEPGTSVINKHLRVTNVFQHRC